MVLLYLSYKRQSVSLLWEEALTTVSFVLLIHINEGPPCYQCLEKHNTNTVIKRNGHRKHNWSCPLHRFLGGGTLCTTSPSPWKQLICFRGGVAAHSVRMSRVHRLPTFPFEAAFLNNFHRPKCPQTSISYWLVTLRWNWSQVHDHNGLQITLPSSLHLPFFSVLRTKY